MTMRDWINKSGIGLHSATIKQGAVSVCIDQLNPHRPDLWKLSDYVVGSVCGIVIWLRKRRN